MLQGLKTSVAVLVGLVLGLIAAVPLAWHGTRKGADSLVHNVGQSLAAVEQRQQAMADQALELQVLLARHANRSQADLFEAVQAERSRLAGQAGVREKLQQAQRLEEALLRVERHFIQAGLADERLRKSHSYQEHGRVWEKQKRYLVREQFHAEDAVSEVNHLLARWPLGQLLRYKSFGALLRGTFGDILGNTAFLFRLGLDWLGYGMRRAAALVGQQDPPEPPKWDRPKPQAEAAYLDPLRPPVWLADAPVPEDAVDELQFTREGLQKVDYADVNVGEDPAVLENRHAPEPYAGAVPTVQKTVDYRGER